jgi:hypothetical protein
VEGTFHDCSLESYTFDDGRLTLKYASDDEVAISGVDFLYDDANHDEFHWTSQTA